MTFCNNKTKSITTTTVFLKTALRALGKSRDRKKIIRHSMYPVFHKEFVSQVPFNFSLKKFLFEVKRFG